MQKIASFQVNHLTLQKGMYTSRIDGDIVTYDIRMCRPNGGAYLENAGLHTFEHLFATYVRNSRFSPNVVYVGPMGCRTGFYFLVRNISHTEAIKLVQDSFAFIRDYEGDIPGASEIECGNYLDHDLAAAKRYAADMCGVLNGYTEERLHYAE
ncbi:S-ribosylhomocysteine lyase [Acetanaerobacterium elongatum]|uniref:S-ribosylhomocysteine lyase n=1 Tax=Acetanaerobacterium elongatum TaxID=258515 RepID=A0A1H0CGX1_9FIRM|nr:S-ribosylhomocysteine lyase [Acetanaerobacterium elongatum]SDN57031.1 S-ribosylhomocysteine lyase /quorum-sensing autoinducer 2 (AI-2) synthesis protein LuxS [Acetanaerobacterium elongatum]